MNGTSTFFAAGGFIVNHPGILLVIVGVAGEVICDWNRKKELRERLKKFFGIVLVIGLLWEIAEAVKSDKQVAAAKLLADEANERASTNELQVAKITQTNLLLQAKVLEIEAKNKWRTISPEQKKLFIDSTKNVLKLPIRVRMGASANAEIQSFGNRIREVLDEAGFVETNKDLAIAEWPPEMNVLWNGTGPELPPILFLNNISTMSKPVDLKNAQEKLKTYASYSTNTIVRTEFAFMNDDSDPEAYVTDDNGNPILHIKFADRAPFQMSGFMTVQSAFSAMGIQSQWMTSTNIPSGICEIFINPK